MKKSEFFSEEEKSTNGESESDQKATISIQP